MNNLEKEVRQILEHYLIVYGENALRDRIIERSVSDLVNNFGVQASSATLIVIDMLDQLVSDGIIEIVPYTEMTFDQRSSEKYSSGVYYKLVKI